MFTLPAVALPFSSGPFGGCKAKAGAQLILGSAGVEQSPRAGRFSPVGAEGWSSSAVRKG